MLVLGAETLGCSALTGAVTVGLAAAPVWATAGSCAACEAWLPALWDAVVRRAATAALAPCFSAWLGTTLACTAAAAFDEEPETFEALLPTAAGAGFAVVEVAAEANANC